MRQTMSFRRIIEHKNKIETAKETINLVEENSILIIEADNWEKLRKLSVKGDENFSLEIKD